MASDETVDVQTDDPKGRSALKPYAQRKPPPARRERRQQDRPQRQSGSILGPQWDGFNSFSVEQVASISRIEQVGRVSGRGPRGNSDSQDWRSPDLPAARGRKAAQRLTGHRRRCARPA